MMERTFLVEMVLMRLIKADKRLAERIQKKLNFSNYQMLCLSWAIGLVMGLAIAILFFELSVAKDNTFKWSVITYLAIPILLIITVYGYLILK